MTLTSDKLPVRQPRPPAVTQADHRSPRHRTPTSSTVNVQARASGQFKVAMVLRSPVGGMVLSSGQVSVRSTATSVVGIVLSARGGARAGGVVDPHLAKRRRARRAEPPVTAAGRAVVDG